MYSLQIFKGKDLKAKSMEELARLFGKSGIYYYNVVRGIHHGEVKPHRITEKGIGNGISIVLVINIISRLPQDLSNLFEQFVFGKAPATAILAVVIIFAIIIAMVVLVIILNDGVRKIPVQYAKKMQGRKMVGGQTSNIPFKVNTSGVIPIIFAQSIMQFPIIICSFIGYNGTGVWAEILKGLNSGYWCKPSQPIYSLGLLLYIVLIVFFAYFYTSITFNPLMIADNMKKQGGFIPGIRPGKPTSDYLNKILNYIVFIGAIGLIIVSVILLNFRLLKSLITFFNPPK
jgi:preprotein translocase subunit SecY